MERHYAGDRGGVNVARLESVEQAFTQFIEDFTDDSGVFKYDQRISELAVKGEKSFIIDFTDLYSFDMDLAQLIMNDPEGNTSIFHNCRAKQTQNPRPNLR